MSQQSTRTVLMVDDHQDVLDATARYLSQRGFRVVKSASPFGVSALVHHEKPDVLVLDVMMPGLDGRTLARLLTSSPDRPELALILYSALPVEELQAIAREIPGCSYVGKADGVAALTAEVMRCSRG